MTYTTAETNANLTIAKSMSEWALAFRLVDAKVCLSSAEHISYPYANKSSKIKVILDINTPYPPRFKLQLVQALYSATLSSFIAEYLNPKVLMTTDGINPIVVR
ncbi:unnamed protein product [Blepharisma stoltei]|uniref:Uncharacterized protein n=1 Tax=Blepharisma stoltei TaxID=1481888 RepID=A0AAU9IQD3_9CILI|nr:unnamed protein product [Blepharisma stoltei]